LLVKVGPVWIDLFEIYCGTVWENFSKQLMTFFISFFQLIFVSSPGLLMKTAYSICKNDLTLLHHLQQK